MTRCGRGRPTLSPGCANAREGEVPCSYDTTVKPQHVPINRLPEVDRATRRAIEKVVASGWYILGPELEAFEREFAQYCGTEYCVGLASGTDAIEMALRALDVDRESEVITAANAGGYSSTAIWTIGATPRYADVDPESHCLTVASVARAASPRTRVIVVTHLYGRMAPEIAAICRWAEERGISVVEDCAQASGASLGGRRAGAYGDVGTYSFYPTKNLGALGDAGAVVTARAEVATGVRARRQYGWSERYIMETVGGRNSRMDELQAAVLRVRLQNLDRENQRRREILTAFAERVSPEYGRFAGVIDESNVAHLAVAVVPGDRSSFQRHLASRSIGSAVHYPVPDFNQKVARALGVHVDADAAACASTQWLCDHIVTVPCFPGMTDDEVERVCEALTAYPEK